MTQGDSEMIYQALGVDMKRVEDLEIKWEQTQVGYQKPNADVVDKYRIKFNDNYTDKEIEEYARTEINKCEFSDKDKRWFYERYYTFAKNDDWYDYQVVLPTVD